MKKILLLFVAALMVVASSCKKDDTSTTNDNTQAGNDGIYKPVEKIANYYYWYDYEGTWITEERWNWSNKGLLESIDCLSWDGFVDRSYLYSYEGNRIARVEDSNYSGRYMKYSYNNGRLMKASYYYDDELSEEYVFRYAGDKVSEIELTYYDDGPKDSSESPFRWLIHRKGQQSKGDIVEATSKAKITWSGENISKLTYTTEWYEDDEHGVETGEMVLAFDNKNNPKKGFLSLRFNGDEILSYYCKNNIVKENNNWTEKVYNSEGELINEYSSSSYYDYEYEYDQAGCPTMITTIENGDYDDSYTYRYEYQ